MLCQALANHARHGEFDTSVVPTILTLVLLGIAVRPSRIKSLRRIASICLVAVCGLLSGCSSLVGSWRSVAIDPPSASYPIESLSFDDILYTASWSLDGEPRTDTGRYSWNGKRLDILENGSIRRSFDARLKGEQTLLITVKQQDRTIVTTMVRQEDG